MSWTDERLPACCFYSAHASWDYFTDFESSKNSSGLLVPHTQCNHCGCCCKVSRYIDPHQNTRVPSTRHVTPQCALLCTTQCVLQRCSYWLRPSCTVNKYKETNFQQAADGAVYCFQWRYIVVRVDVVIDSKQQREKYIVMLTARMFNVNVTSCCLPLSLFRPEGRTNFHSDTDSR